MIGDRPPCLVTRSKTDVTRSRRLTQATYATLTVMTAFLLSYLPYWLVCIEFLRKYVRYYYLNEQVLFQFWFGSCKILNCEIKYLNSKLEFWNGQNHDKPGPRLQDINAFHTKLQRILHVMLICILGLNMIWPV